MKILHCLIALGLISFTSCSSLTKTQIRSIQNYSKLLECNSDYPGLIINEYININYEIQKLNTGTFNDEEVNDKLWNSLKGKNKSLIKAQNVDLSIKIMGEYASSLLKLSSNELYENITSPTDKLGSNIEALIQKFNEVNKNNIPIGIGKLVSTSTAKLGQGYVKSKQVEDLKLFIKEGEILISITASSIENNLDTLLLKQWIPGLINDLKIRQENLLRNLNPRGDYKVYFANQFNREVADLIERIDRLEHLTRKTISSVKNLQKAHHELYINIEKRKNIREVLDETQELFISTKAILDAYKSITPSQTTTLE